MSCWSQQQQQGYTLLILKMLLLYFNKTVAKIRAAEREAFMFADDATICVSVCVDQGSSVTDGGRQRQESESSSGSGALQSSEEQSFTCQVTQFRKTDPQPVTNFEE